MRANESAAFFPPALLALFIALAPTLCEKTESEEAGEWKGKRKEKEGAVCE